MRIILASYRYLINFICMVCKSISSNQVTNLSSYVCKMRINIKEAVFDTYVFRSVLFYRLIYFNFFLLFCFHMTKMSLHLSDHSVYTKSKSSFRVYVGFLLVTISYNILFKTRFQYVYRMLID